MCREELEELAQSALAALVAGSADGLMPTGSLTVNGEPVGALATIGLTKLEGEVIAADPEAGQVFVLAAGMVKATWTALAIGMRFAGTTLVEVKVFLGSEQTGLYGDAAQLREGDLIYSAPVAPHRRASRDELRRIAGNYLRAISGSKGAAITFDRRCDIYRNGAKFTNTLRSLLWPESKVYDCHALVEAVGSTAAGVRELRFPVTDVELGLVAGIAMVDQRGAAPAFGQLGGTHQVACMVKIVDHSIRCVDEIRCAIAAGASSTLAEGTR